MSATFTRVDQFCSRLQLRVPILLAPMGGVPSVSLSAAVANAGGLGACGVIVMKPQDITPWASDFRAASKGPFQFNNWIPDPPPAQNRGHEARVRAFLEKFGPPVPADAADAGPPDVDAQCAAILDAKPPIVSSVMGLYPPPLVAELKRRGIVWFANISTVTEAKMAADAGADVIVAQGAEAGGHRGAFDPAEAERKLIGRVFPRARDRRRGEAACRCDRRHRGCERRSGRARAGDARRRSRRPDLGRRAPIAGASTARCRLPAAR